MKPCFVFPLNLSFLILNSFQVYSINISLSAKTHSFFGKSTANHCSTHQKVDIYIVNYISINIDLYCNKPKWSVSCKLSNKNRWEFCKLLHKTVKLNQLLFISEIYMSRAPKKSELWAKIKGQHFKVDPVLKINVTYVKWDTHDRFVMKTTTKHRKRNDRFKKRLFY